MSFDRPHIPSDDGVPAREPYHSPEGELVDAGENAGAANTPDAGDSDGVLYEEQVEPQQGLLGFTLRELIIVGSWLVGFIVSFFPIGPIGDTVWTSGIHWILMIGVPTAAVFLLVLRRLSPDGIRRVGSLGIDQFASVAASVAAVSWAQVLWQQVAATIATGVFLIGLAAIVGQLATLSLVIATVFAPFIPALGEDFRGRLETLAHRYANPVRPVTAPSRTAPEPTAPEPTAPVSAEPHGHTTESDSPHARTAGAEVDAEPGSEPPVETALTVVISDERFEPQNRDAAATAADPEETVAPEAVSAAFIQSEPSAHRGAEEPAPVGEGSEQARPEVWPAPDDGWSAEQDQGSESVVEPPVVPARVEPEIVVPESVERQHVGTEAVDEEQAEQEQVDEGPAVSDPVEPPTADPGELGAAAPLRDRENEHAGHDDDVEVLYDTAAVEALREIFAVDETTNPRNNGDHDGPQERVVAPEPERTDSRFEVAEGSADEVEMTLRRTRSAQSAQPPQPEPFWILAPTDREVLDEHGAPLFHIGPRAWALAIEDRGGAFVVRHEDGRIGYLHDISDITKG